MTGRLVAVRLSRIAIRRGERILFEGLDLSLSAGEAVALGGRNGAGKTSLLRCVAGLLRPESGTVAFEGEAGALEAESVGERLHLVGHHDGLKGARSAREELAFQAAWCGGSETGVREAVDRLGLGPLLDLEVRRLSAGQKRRLALARLIAAPRPLWLLDEALAPLDADQRARLGALMAEHLAGGGMILAAAHDPLPIPARAVEVGG